MKYYGIAKRMLAYVMAVAICFSLVPWTVFATETGTYVRVTSAEEFTTGQYVLITETGYAPGVLENGWITALQPTVAEGVVTDTAGAVWTLTVDGSSVALTDANGTSIAPKGGNNNGIQSADYCWAWRFSDGMFTFAGTGSDTVVLSSNIASSNRFRGYRTATVSSNPNSYPSSFTVYKLVEETAKPEPSEPSEPTVSTEPSAPEPSAPAIADGDYVIWAPAYNKALSSKKTGNYNVGVDVTLNGDVLSGFGATEIWTITNNADGTITISQNGSKLSMAESYLNLRMDAANDIWFLSDLGEGLFNVQNVGRSNYLEWYDKFSNWSTYNSGSAATDAQFQIKFTSAVAEEDEPEIPSETEIPSEPAPSTPAIADGDYVIWAPAYNKALSSNKPGNYHVGVDVTLNGDLLSGYGATEIWTVTNNADGTITISQNGSKLSMAESYLTLSMDAANDIWSLTDLGGGLFNVQNVDRANYLEWYDKFGNWSTYHSDCAATDGQFQIMFTPAVQNRAVENVTFTPNGGSLYIEDESFEITLSTATGGATIWFATSTNGETYSDYTVYSEPIAIAKGFGTLYVKAYAEKESFTTSALTEKIFTERISDQYQFFFGQLHSHTNTSDGAGSVEEAFQYASQVENLDFLAVTDHSNSFDNADSGCLSVDGSDVSSEWAAGRAAAAAITSEDFVGLYGFEMTWSNGLGHISTFNTPGWQSRTQDPYKSYSTALQNYYATLATVPESISQFNHPGTAFGDFSDFAHYSKTADALITLIEVGNGEGDIGSSGYFPSYEYYTRALDKGWHLAPTNNQDNHMGNWGDANTGRTVILADALTEEHIYDALRSYRVYASEDNDLEIYYTLNGSIMGSILDADQVDETVNISVRFFDPTDSAIGKVEVIVNGGLSIASQTLNTGSTSAELSVPANYNYYYIKVTQPDGDIAVTAPVWVEKEAAVGISCLEAASSMIIAGEEQIFTAELFNHENKDLIVESLVYTDKATGEVLYTETDICVVGRENTATSSFGYTFASDGVYTITATLKGTLNGIEKACTKDLEISVMPQRIVSRIIVDGTHYNDYVTGDYGGNMNNMTAIAASQGINVHVETEQITAEMLENCSLLVISAPAKKNGTDKAGPYTISEFEDAFLVLVADYVKRGGSVIVCGLADGQDKTNDGIHESSVQINQLLAAIGSTMTINDDAAYDEENNGGQAYQLYPDNFNTASKWCAGILEGQVYSQYSGCTVNPGQGTWLVKGFDSTYSIDSDRDGIGGLEKGEAVFLAAEQTPYGGTIFAAGGVFISDFEVTAELDNIWDLPYANRTIYENIIGITRLQPEITPIADVRASAVTEPGRIFVVEGYVTSGTDNDFTTFFEAIYVQDETGGITAFPYAQEGLELGTKVRITGYTDTYQGDIEIQMLSLEILDAPKNVIEPEKVSAKDAMDYANNGGELLQVVGKVVDVILTSDGKGVAQFVVKDENGDLSKIFIDDYILSGTTGRNTLADIVKVGNTVSAVGLLYMHPEGDSETAVAVLRVRNCDEVLLIKEKVEGKIPTDPSEPIKPDETTEPAEPTEPSEPSGTTEATESTESTESSEPAGPSTSETDKSRLKKAIQKAKSRKQKDYTKKSYNAMLAVLKIAESVYSDEDATQAEIDAATDALNATIEALVPATGKNPETSDRAVIMLPMLFMTVSLLALAVLLFNRKRFAV